MNGKHISKLGFEKRAIGLALTAAATREAAGLDRAAILAELEQVQTDPHAYLQDPLYAELAREVAAQRAATSERAGLALHAAPLPYPVWGERLIEPGARAQMDTAMRLPISVAGALMPDAHVGYGLPIGGVLATEGAVIPYGVGVDIGCSMRLSVLPVDRASNTRAPDTRELVGLLQKHTRFGAGVGWERRDRLDHAVLDDPAWREQPLLRQLHDKAVSQLGTSGSGNHFVEFGTLSLDAPDLGLAAGEYLAVLSHSGSRGFGAQVAGYFTRLAESLRSSLDPAAKKLAWLDLESEAGAAYWQAMQLAGRYALANHEQIHARLAGALKVTPLASVTNSHNLAWEQTLDGREVIVHRKGATPAAAGQLGVIPGSMADPGYVVRGRGEPGSLASASHGAGRALGRRAAENSLVKKEVQAYLQERGVTLLGGGIDEAPQAYKRIDAVMAAQTALVDVVARFTPRVVRMDSGHQDV